MSSTPPGTGACCPPRAEGVTYLKVGPRKVLRGMMGLEMVFQQLYAMGRRPDETTDAELVGMARKFNYIPDRPAVEADYAEALRDAYSRFYARHEEEEHKEQVREEASDNRSAQARPTVSDTPGTDVGTLFRNLLERLGTR